MYECLNTPRNPLKLCTTHAESSALEPPARRGSTSGRCFWGRVGQRSWRRRSSCITLHRQLFTSAQLASQNRNGGEKDRCFRSKLFTLRKTIKKQLF